MTFFCPSVLDPFVYGFPNVSYVRQCWKISTASLIEVDCPPFLDWTNTSAVIAVIYWHATVISLHLNNKWHQNLCSSIISDTPKVTEINPWIYTQTRSLNLCPIHLCPLYVFQIFSIILWSETSFLFFFNIHLVFFSV